MHPGIEKQTLLFKEIFYFPDYRNLIQKFANEFEICNIAKTEHRNKNHSYEITPEIFNARDKYVIDFYLIDNKQFLYCIGVYSKNATLIDRSQENPT